VDNPLSFLQVKNRVVRDRRGEHTGHWAPFHAAYHPKNVSSRNEGDKINFTSQTKFCLKKKKKVSITGTYLRTFSN
jgi:hypothetical protein